MRKILIRMVLTLIVFTFLSASMSLPFVTEEADSAWASGGRTQEEEAAKRAAQDEKKRKKAEEKAAKQPTQGDQECLGNQWDPDFALHCPEFF